MQSIKQKDKNHVIFLIDTEKACDKIQFPWMIAKTILNNKKTAEEITTPNFKLYHRPIVVKHYILYKHKNRQIDEWK